MNVVEKDFIKNGKILNHREFKELDKSIKTDIADIHNLFNNITEDVSKEKILSKEETIEKLRILLSQIENYEIECDQTLESIVETLNYFNVKN